MLKELGATPDEMIRIGKSQEGCMIDIMRVITRHYYDVIKGDHDAIQEKERREKERRREKG